MTLTDEFGNFDDFGSDEFDKDDFDLTNLNMGTFTFSTLYLKQAKD